MIQLLKLVWVVKAVFKVHIEAIKSQNEDGEGSGLDIPDDDGRCEAESHGEMSSKRHLGMSY